MRDKELVALERTLHHELSGSEVQLSSTNILKAYGIKISMSQQGFLGFLRHILELEDIPDYASVIARAFQAHITSHNYSGDQIRFLRSVQEVFLQKRKLAEVDLYEPPLTIFGRNAVEQLFTPTQIKERAFGQQNPSCIAWPAYASPAVARSRKATAEGHPSMREERGTQWSQNRPRCAGDELLRTFRFPYLA